MLIRVESNGADPDQFKTAEIFSQHMTCRSGIHFMHARIDVHVPKLLIVHCMQLWTKANFG